MSNKLFVGGLSPNTDDSMIRAAFAPFGELTEARVILDRDTGRSRGFGFVRYIAPEMARAALEAMSGAMLDGRSIRVDLAEDRPGPGAPGGGGGGTRDGGGRWGDAPSGGAPPTSGRWGERPAAGAAPAPTSGRWGERPAPGAAGAPTSGRWGERPAPGAAGAPTSGRWGERPAPGAPGRFGDRPSGPGGAPGGFRPRPGGPGGAPGGAGGNFGAPAADEGAWDDARMPRRTEPTKKAGTREAEPDRRPNKLAPKEKRVSGKSWRQWTADDDDGAGGNDGGDGGDEG